MRLFIVTCNIPFCSHGEPGVTAMHIASFALLKELQNLGHEVFLQCVFVASRGRKPLSEAEERAVNVLQEEGMDVLPPLFLADISLVPSVALRSLQMLLFPQTALEHFYPGVRLRARLYRSMENSHADIVLPLWFPQGVAATTQHPHIPCVAYHGDIDYDPMMCRYIHDPELFFGKSSSWWNLAVLLQHLDRRLRLFAYRRAHVRLMRMTEGIANNAACQSVFYTEHGHPRSVYVGNTWVDTGASGLAAYTSKTFSMPCKIIGHVGYLDRTGSTYGLLFLLRDVLPCLREEMRGHPFEVHIIGGGTAMPGVQPYLDQENVVRHGFVEDLDRELNSADVFCLFNNAGPFFAAFTRPIIAWSMGLCLIVHSNSTKAIPEIQHGKNALCVSNPQEAARCIARAALDRDMNLRLRRNGRKTYEERFTPAKIAERIDRLMREVVEERRGTRK